MCLFLPSVHRVLLFPYNFRNDVDSKEELDNLLEESAMPLQSLLARYNAPLQADSRSKEAPPTC